MPAAVSRIKLYCEICGNPFERRQKEIDRGRGRFCSARCRATSLHTGQTFFCPECGKAFYRNQADQIKNKRGQNFCSQSCYKTFASRNQHSYKKQGAKHLHRIVAEKKLGRPLRPDEVVHHKDHNRLNNDPSNLEVITRPEHGRLHSHDFQRERGPRGTFVKKDGNCG